MIFRMVPPLPLCCVFQSLGQLQMSEEIPYFGRDRKKSYEKRRKIKTDYYFKYSTKKAPENMNRPLGSEHRIKRVHKFSLVSLTFKLVPKMNIGSVFKKRRFEYISLLPKN